MEIKAFDKSIAKFKSRWLVILLLIFLSGCSTYQPLDTEPESALTRGKIQAELNALNISVSLKKILSDEVTLFSVQEINKLSSFLGKPKALLHEILLITDTAQLVANDKFVSLVGVVIGEPSDVEKYFNDAFINYFLDPTFACKQPIFTNYFNHRYAAFTAPINCESEAVPFSKMTQYGEEQIIWIDPRRISSIHLLFAGNSEQLASRFGHVALRLIVCPEKSSSDDECKVNLREHIVLGFQAHIDDYSINTLKGLMGTYNAYLFAYPFMDAYENYAINEFREIFSLPLVMDNDTREYMIRGLSEIHWRYKGDYKFFTKNCATLLQNAFRQIWPEYAQILPDNSMRPDTFFQVMQNNKLTDADKLFPLEYAESNGYHFASTKQYYDAAFNYVLKEMSSPLFGNLASYLAIPPVERRNNMLKDTTYLDRLRSDKKLLDAQFMMEEYAVINSERLMMIAAAGYLEEQNFTERYKEIELELDEKQKKVFRRCIVEPIKQRMQPIRRSDGIPFNELFEKAEVAKAFCYSQENRGIFLDAMLTIKGAKSENWYTLNAMTRYWSESIANVLFLEKISAL